MVLAGLLVGRRRWAVRRYPPDGEKLRRATARDARNSALQERLFNLIGGAPSSGANDGRDP